MREIRNRQPGFTTVEVLLVLIFVAIVVLIGVYVFHNRSNNTKTTTNTTTSTLHTADEATTFVQKTYDDFLTAVNNVGPGNTQPLGQVGLVAVKANLSADFYAKAAASDNAGDFSCAAQFVPSSYTASLASSNKTSVTVALTIAGNTEGSADTKGMTVDVDLASLKITSVHCPA